MQQLKLVMIMLCINTFVSTVNVSGQTVENAKNDSIVSSIKASIYALYAPSIFESKSVDPKTIRATAIKQFGETGEQMMLDMLALKYYLLFTKNKIKRWLILIAGLISKRN
jgi:hypothetical protein